MIPKQVGKQAIQAIADKQNKASTLKEAIINAAEDTNRIKTQLTKIEIEKTTKEAEGKNETKIDVQDLKNAEKIVIGDIEGR